MDSISVLIAEISSSVKSKHAKSASEIVPQILNMVKLMQSKDTTPQDLQRINVFFKTRLSPMYNSCTDLMFRLASKLLEYTLSVEKLASGPEVNLLWNSIPGSIATGILDFLEADKKASTRTLVASRLYETICNNYLPSSSMPHTSFQRANAATLTALFQLLSDSVVGQPGNQSKLRHPKFLGGARIGLTLVKLRDFLPIEALLELFANLLPSAQVAGGQEKRAHFIKQVFNSVDFPNHSEIAAILDLPVSDWTVTSQKVSDLLAASQPSHPQPFQTSRIVIGNSEAYAIDRIYVDGSGFLASIDEGDSLGTLQLPYREIEQFSISKPSKGEVTVTLTSKIPPIKNQEMMPRPLSQEEGQCKCSWMVKATAAEKFIQTLRHRKLDRLVGGGPRKMSLVPHALELVDIHPPVPSQVKEASYWSHTDVHKTSPSAPESTKSRASAGNTPLVLRPLSDATSFTVTETTLGATAGLKHTKANLSSRQVVDDGQLLPELTDSEIGLSPSKVAHKFKHQNERTPLPKPENELDSTPDQFRQGVRKNLLPTEGDTTLRPANVQISARKPRKPTIEVNSTRQTRSTTRVLKANVESPPLLPTPSPKTHKRARQNERVGSGSLEDSEEPPTKRIRVQGETEMYKHNLRSARQLKPDRPRPRPVKKYRAKERASSPTPASREMNKENMPSMTKSAVTRMKGKDGKSGMPKPKPVKPPPPVIKEARAKEHRLREIIDLSCERENRVKTPKPPGQLDATSKVVNSKLANEDVQAGRKKPGEERSLKLKKAPWDDSSITTKLELSKSEIDTSSMQLSELVEHPVPEFDAQMWEADRPLSPSPGLRKPNKPQDDAEMIDLTHNSPAPKVDRGITPPTFPQLRKHSLEIPTALVTLDTPVLQTSKNHTLPEVGRLSPPNPAKAAGVKKIMVDEGIQVDVQEPTPVAPQPLLLRKALTMTLPSVKLVSKIQSVPRLSPSTSTPMSESRFVKSPSVINKPRVIRKISENKEVDPSPETLRFSNRSRAPEVINRGIVDVLNNINDVILGRIESKFEGVRGDLKIAQDAMLEKTFDKLDQLRSKSTEHFNMLVELYDNYAAERRKNLQLYDDMARANRDALDGVNNIILMHNRQGLSKKFPKSLFINIPANLV